MTKKLLRSFRTQRGFTLIELVIYIGILSILLGVLSSIFTAIVDVQLESEATSSVDQDGRYLLAKLSYDVQQLNPYAHSTDAVVIPANPGDTSDTMQLNINSILYTYSLDANDNLQVTDSGAGNSYQLNSYDTSVSNVSFTRVGSGDSNDTVQVSYTINSRTKERSGQETKSFQTTLGKQ